MSTAADQGWEWAGPQTKQPTIPPRPRTEPTNGRAA